MPRRVSRAAPARRVILFRRWEAKPVAGLPVGPARGILCLVTCALLGPACWEQPLPTGPGPAPPAPPRPGPAPRPSPLCVCGLAPDLRSSNPGSSGTPGLWFLADFFKLQCAHLKRGQHSPHFSGSDVVVLPSSAQRPRAGAPSVWACLSPGETSLAPLRRPPPPPAATAPRDPAGRPWVPRLGPAFPRPRGAGFRGARRCPTPPLRAGPSAPRPSPRALRSV